MEFSACDTSGGGRRFGSTRALMEANGLWSAIRRSGAEPRLFDDQGFEEGYVEATQDFPGSHWKCPLHVARIAVQVDHIVTLGTIADHRFAGLGLGHGSAVGWMREDSRFHLHYNGGTYQEKLAEASHVREIRTRHRLALTVAESCLLEQGAGTGSVVPADPLVVIGSADLANHDALAAAVLVHAASTVPRVSSRLWQDQGDRVNLRNLVYMLAVNRISGVPWCYEPMGHRTPLASHPFQRGIRSDRILARAYGLRGGIPERIEVALDGIPPAGSLVKAIAAHGEGRFRLA